MSISALRRRAREARFWLFDACFPLWSEKGSGDAGLFREGLTLDHSQMPEDTTRVRVQARQTFIFAQAAMLGWKPDAAMEDVEQGVRILSGLARRPDGLTGHRIHCDGSGLADDTPDLYDLAFALYALANASMVVEDGGSVLASARALIDAAEGRLKDRTNGGYAERLPPPQTRSQNPHMHMLEAFLALHVADPEGGYLDKAAELIQLFETKLTAGPGNLLGETFKADWSEPDGEAAMIVEPGHQFEWVWLLDLYSKLSGEALNPAAGRLYSFATGTLDSSGRTLLEVKRDGSVHNAGRRTWGQAEALQAHLMMLRLTGEESFAAAACTSFDILMDEHLTPEGGWIDHIDETGQTLSHFMPASSGYHVVLAFADLIQTMEA